eukprot:406184_1
MTTISHDQYDKPINRKQWQSDSDSPNCNVCQIRIIASILRSNKHHCRYCGKVVCGSCSINTSNTTHVLAIDIKHRICDLCHAKKKELKESMIKLSSHIPESVLQDSSDPIQISPNVHMFVSSYRSDHAMYCYDAINDKWTKKSKQKINKHSISQDIVAFNKNTDEVYSISSKYSRFPVQLKKINIKRKTVKSIELSSNDHKIYEQALKDAKCIVINDILHIIGGKQSNRHYILDETKCELIPQWSFRGMNMLQGAGLVYLETKETLYLFGGIIKERLTLRFDRKSNCIYKCYPSNSNMTKCVWKKLDVKMPFKTSDIVVTSCKNDKYILLFDTGLFTQDIYIFDVDKEKFIKSLVKCPISGSVMSDAKAFVPNNYTYKTHKMNTLLYGYFHATNTSYASYHISTDIINLISTFISFGGEFVHIFGGLVDNSTHWKININYILNNVKTNKEINLFGFLRALGGLRGILDSR